MSNIKNFISKIIDFCDRLYRLFFNIYYDDQEIKYNLDILVSECGHIFVVGWLFDKNGNNIDLSISLKEKRHREVVSVELEDREDVAKVYSIDDRKVGFRSEIYYLSQNNGKVYLTYRRGKNKYYIEICDYAATDYNNRLKISKNNTCMSKEDFFTLKDMVVNEYVPVTLKGFTDVIVPVYNGFEYLENLFKGIEKTKLPYHLYIVNDNSSDERVLPFLVNYSNEHENVILIENEKNLGFVQSVNKAMLMSSNNVAIVNTDVILPEYWLERLMYPIQKYTDVASSTPFTNSGTICSFPNFCDNNAIFLNKGVGDIDKEFACIKPVFNIIPTGVGFCMGMKREVIDKIGLFDAESFNKGYCEENDWCQRAIQNGYHNVMVENLFVWHKHGGSFLSEDKKRYIENNHKLLLEKHPEYDKDVAAYCRRDPVKKLREYVKWNILINETDGFYFIIDHNWGGGANTYCFDRIKELNEKGIGAIRIINDVEKGLFLECRFLEQTASVYFDSFEELFDFIKNIKCIKIVVNEIVSFESPKIIHDFILKLKQTYNVDVLMLIHDYYSVCPSIYLMDDKGKHCYFADKEKCYKCFDNNTEKFNDSYKSIDEWRNDWNVFFAECNEIRVFSNNTKTYLQHFYKGIDNITVVPHKVDYISQVNRQVKTYNGTTIAVIGNFMRTKGSDIICEMADIIEKDGINARIVVIGSDLVGVNNNNINIHGAYKREELPELIEKYEVDIIFIASIWPETFSYTTEEAMLMGMPVAAFNIGAPAERIKEYDKGLIINEMNADKALSVIIEFTKN